MKMDIRSQMARLAGRLAKAPLAAQPKARKRAPRKPAPEAPSNVTTLTVVPKATVKVKPEHVARARRRPAAAERMAGTPFRLPDFPPAALPPKDQQLAQDEAITQTLGWATAAYMNAASFWEGQQFLGYPYLAELAQRPEYRRMVGRIAEECTRKWLKFTAEGDESLDDETPIEDRLRDKARANRIKKIKDRFAELEVQQRCQALVETDGYMGRAHLFLDFGNRNDADEQRVSIGNGCEAISKMKVDQNRKLRRLAVVEPMWTYPGNYDSSDPLSENWYRPERWYVMSREIHRTRLIPFVTRPVPDMLKAAYGFGGLALTQLAKPYVDNWLRTRQSVSDLVHSFSTMVLETDLGTALQGAGDDLFARIDLFNALRDNRGLMAINKGNESFSNVTTPLGTVDALQAQSQEQMASVCGIPIVILLGIQPMGLNASSDGEIRVFYDLINAFQNAHLRPIVKSVMDFVQLSEFGSIDEGIGFDFLPLWSLDEKSRSEARRTDAETDQTLIDAGVLHPQEARARIAADPDSPYASIDVDDVPEPPADPTGGDPFGMGGGEDPPAGPGEPRDGPPGGADDVDPFAFDAEWEEGKHPRDQDGKFTSGAGSHAKGAEPAKPAKAKSAPKKASPSPQKAASATWGKAKIQIKDLKPAGPKMGSNPGGVYEDKYGNKYYAKHLKSPAHVTNELTAASLYKLAGSNTLDYVPVGDSDHTVATKFAKLDKANVKDLTTKEKREAQKDFVVHAWLANWDAAGTGGDNVGVKGGKVTTLDVGGALEFRAQGAPKGKAFGEHVGEIAAMTDPKTNSDSAQLYGAMTAEEMAEAAKKVTSLSDEQIRATVKAAGGSDELAEKLIKRRDSIAAQFGQKEGGKEQPFSDEAFEALHPRGPGGKFATKAGGDVPDGKELLDDATAKLMEAVVDGKSWDEAKASLTEAEIEALGELGGAQETFADMVSQHEEHAAEVAPAAVKAPAKEEPAPKPGEVKVGETPDKGKKTAFGGLFKTGATKTEAYANTVNHVLGKPANAGSSYRQMLAHLIQEAPKHGYEDKVPELTTKLGEAWKNAGWKATADADAAADPAKKAELQKIAKKAFQKAHALGVPASAGGGNTDPTPAAPAEPTATKEHALKFTSPAFTKFVKDLDVAGSAPPMVAAKMKIKAAVDTQGATLEALEAILTPEEKKALKAEPSGGTVAEFYEKMVKNKTSAPAPKASAESKAKTDADLKNKLKDKFAANTASKGALSDLDKAKQIVKAAVQVGAPADMAKGLLTEAQIKAMESQYGSVEKAYQKGKEYDDKAKQIEAQQKAAEAAEIEAQKAMAAAAMAAMNTPEMKEHYDVLAGVASGAEQYLKFAESKVASAGLQGKISPAEAASIVAYSGSHYVGVNQQLRAGVMTEEQFKFARDLNRALDKLPKHVGVTTRGTNLTPQQLALYQPGMIIEERGFMSTGKGFKFSGNVAFEVHGKNGRDISKLSSHPSESEVLFKAGSRFKVVSKTANKIVLHEIDY